MNAARRHGARGESGAPGLEWATTVNWLLLAGAWIAAWIVYSPALHAPWFYDDSDYVLNDPRLTRLELFSPAHWSDPPPALDNPHDEALHLPGYGKPLINDRYLWRLSFALERRLLGASYSAAVAHAVNLFIHLACIGALFFALSRLLALYRQPPDGIPGTRSTSNMSPEFAAGAWAYLPGVASLVFAVHPWAAEPVCYVSARNASMGALFVLLGVGLWASALRTARPWRWRTLELAGALLCALAAYSCKENFITAAAGYVLVTWPVLWERLRKVSRVRMAGVCAAVVAGIACVVWLGSRGSERAAGLWAQAGARGWEYLFEIQGPLLLMTLSDQALALRLSIEANHPGWPVLACAAALAANAALGLVGVLGGKRWPLLLGLGWFYLHLLPSNSILPRPDFLAARNVYLPAAGMAVLFAGVLLWVVSRARRSNAGYGAGAVVLAAAASMYWAARAHEWADCFAKPLRVWERSAAVAPDHAAVRLNLAAAILDRRGPEAPRQEELADAERELRAALAAEDSATMKYHTERPKAVRRGYALHRLGLVHYLRHDAAAAEQAFRQSFSALPSTTTWVGWGGACLQGGLWPQLQDVIAAGQSRWPDKWWPQALRGLMLGAQAGSRLPENAQRDLGAAEAAPDEAMPELRMLQCLAIGRLAQAETTVGRRQQLLQRVECLSTPPKAK